MKAIEKARMEFNKLLSANYGYQDLHEKAYKELEEENKRLTEHIKNGKDVYDSLIEKENKQLKEKYDKLENENKQWQEIFADCKDCDKFEKIGEKK